MKQDRVCFQVTALAANAESVPIEWQGREVPSGPLEISLDETVPVEENRGTLDYARRRAQATFHVRLSFPELSAIMADLGVDRAMTRPIRAVLRSEGNILEDHSFALSGRCHMRPHPLFSDASAGAAVLPGH